MLWQRLIDKGIDKLVEEYLSRYYVDILELFTTRTKHVCACKKELWGHLHKELSWGYIPIGKLFMVHHSTVQRALEGRK